MLLLLLPVAERITAGAIGAVGRDLHRIKTAIRAVDVMLAGAHVTANGIINFFHNVLLSHISRQRRRSARKSAKSYNNVLLALPKATNCRKATAKTYLKIMCANFRKLPLTGTIK